MCSSVAISFVDRTIFQPKAPQTYSNLCFFAEMLAQETLAKENQELAQENQDEKNLSAEDSVQSTEDSVQPALNTLPFDDFDEPEDSLQQREAPQFDPKLFEMAQKEAALQLGHSYSRKLLPIALLVLILLSVLIGGVLGHITANELLATTDHHQYRQLLDKLISYSGLLANIGFDYAAIGVSMWFALSSLAGGLALIIPIDVYFMVARSHLSSKHAGSAVADLIKAEVYKYGLVILMLGFLLKETNLFAPIMLSTFVLLSFCAMVIQLFSLPQPSPEFTRYMTIKKMREHSKAKPE